MRKLFARLVVGLTVLALLLASVVAVKGPAWLETAKNAVIQAAEAKIDGKIVIDRIDVTWHSGIHFKQVRLLDKQGGVVAESPDVSVDLNYYRLLVGHEPMAAVRAVHVEQPAFSLVEKAGRWNTEGLIKPQEVAEPVFYGRVYVHNGQGRVVTETADQAFTLDGSIDAGVWPEYGVEAKLGIDGDVIAVSGRIDRSGSGELSAQTERLDVARVIKLVQDKLPLKLTQGSVRNAQVRLLRRDGQVDWRGKALVEQLQAEYGGHQVMAEGRIALEGHDLLLTQAAVSQPGMAQALDVRGRINGVLRGEIAGAALDVAGKAFPLAALAPWLPETITSDLLLEATLDQLIVSVDWQGDTITVPVLQAQTAGGSLSASGVYQWEQGGLQASGQWSNLDPMQFWRGADGRIWSGATSGRMTANGNVKTNTWQGQASVTAGQANVYGVAASALTAEFHLLPSKAVSGAAFGNLAGGSFFASGQASPTSMAGHLEASGVQIEQLAAPFGVRAGGTGRLTADVGGTPALPRAAVELAAQDGNALGQPFTLARAELTFDERVLRIHRAWLGDVASGHQLQGSVNLQGAEPVVDLTLASSGVRLEPVAALLAPGTPLTGNLSQTVHIAGPLSNPSATGKLRLTDGSAYKQLIARAQVDYTYENGTLRLAEGQIVSLDTRLDFAGDLALSGACNLKLSAQDIDLARLLLPPEIGLTGIMQFDGLLTGSLAQPVFDGRLRAHKLNLNGQDINDVNSELHHRAGITHVPSFAFQIGRGKYELNATYYSKEDQLVGRMSAVDGDLTPIFQIAKLQEQAVKGTLNGDVTFDVQPKNVGVSIEGNIKDGSWRGLPIQQVELAVALKDRRWTINKFEARQGAGFLVARGTADLDGEINVELGGNKLDAALLAAARKTQVPFGGDMNLFVQVSGKTQNPNMAMSLEISPGRVGPGTFDNLYAMATLENKIFKVNQLFVRKGEYQASAYGTVPLAAVTAKSGSQEARDNPIDLRFKLDRADLSILPLFSREIEWGTGKTTGEVALRGTLGDLKAYGEFQVQDGVIRLAKLRQPIEKVNIAITLQDDRIVIRDFSGNMGTGSWRLGGEAVIAGLELANYDVKLALNKAMLDSSLFKGMLDGSLRLYQRNGNPALQGEVLVDNATINIPLVAQGETALPFAYLDALVKIGPKTRLYNPYLYDLPIVGQIDVKGSTRFPRIGGRVEATKGTVTYLRTPFKIHKALATWPKPGSFLPMINLEGEARLSETMINLGVNGTIDELDLKLSADPPMSQQEIIYLLTMRQRYQDARDKGGGAPEFGRTEAMGLLEVGLQARFLSELEYTIRTALGLDEFRLFSGPPTDASGKTQKLQRSDNEQIYNLEVGKYVTDRIKIGYTTTTNREYYHYKLQYDFSHRINFAATVDKDNDRWYGVEMRFSF